LIFNFFSMFFSSLGNIFDFFSEYLHTPGIGARAGTEVIFVLFLQDKMLLVQSVRSRRGGGGGKKGRKGASGAAASATAPRRIQQQDGELAAAALNFLGM
jgi:hypothetical protein